ncbi:MAG TPA: ABC transporter permease, partial [Bacteroidia bacterium]|nr:ABC transporter permease [Bacteroidia bacterium]
MFKSYFKTALRNLLRNKIFSLINIAGISIALTCCLLLTLYIKYQVSFDKFNSKADRIVRVIMQYNEGGEVDKGNFTSAYVLPSFKSKFPEIESGVRMLPATNVVKYGDKIINQKNFLYADPALFKIFDFKLLRGDPNQVLKNPKALVLTQTTARKYFGDEDPIGKTLMIGDKQIPYTVSGIAADCPPNSQIRFSVVASFASAVPEIENTYFNANYTTYFLLKDKQSIASLQQKIPPFMKQEMKGTGATITYDLEPLTTIHLHSPYDAMVPNLDVSYIYIIGGIALLILAIACFSYINMSTASASGRAKEVGVRKVNGAYRSQIFWQFICESFILTLISVLLGYVAAVFLLPSFNVLAG